MSTEPAAAHVVEKKAHEIDSTDEIFDSLRDGYDDFDKWWRNKCVAEHRLCWVVEQGLELAGICVRKHEPRSEATVTLSGEKILKLCTFKVKPEFRGEKLGELLLKQALWFAQRNNFDLIYLTTFPDQTFLIQILEYFGFFHTITQKNGEYVYEKQLSSTRLEINAGDDLFTVDRLNYPRFVSQNPAVAFCVPIKGIFHRKLFPEIAMQDPLPLFPDQMNFQTGGGETRTPGNTIRKVYLCRAPTNQMKPGDLLLFYESKSPDFVASQSVTSIGVLESVISTQDFDELVRLTAKRSVYSQADLKELLAERDAPIKVLDFLLVGHLEPPMRLSELLAADIFSGRPPQSISRLDVEAIEHFKPRMKFGFDV